MSSFAAPSFNNGCTSVLANTPQRDAIGYIVLYPFTNSFNPFVSVFNNDAIWSKNAPVPPAHVPFIRCSIDFPKYIILASSPPSSITTSVCGIYFSTALLHATTSCINGTSKNFAVLIAPEPVNAIVNSFSLYFSTNSSNTLHTVFLVSEKCLSYDVCITSSSSLITTIFTVVEPTSIPICTICFIFYLYLLRIFPYILINSFHNA